MVYSKIKKILFILLCLFIIFFPFWCVRGLCAESENVTYDIVNNLTITSNSNVFTYAENASSFSVGYITLEPDYIYTITNNTTGFTNIGIGTTNEIPALNVPYTYLYTLPIGESYTFRGNGNIYLAFRSNASSSSNFPVVTRNKVTGMNSTINDLVDNVGINSFWNVFDISINYIVIVVLVAFGLFIVFKIIRKITKGKEGL